MVAFWGKPSARLGAALALVAMLVASAPASAATAIARAADVRPEATGLIEGQSLVLSASDDLFEGQTITTGPRGQVQIVFADDTRMVVGPGSSLVIEKYLMRNGGTASEFAVSALGGTFRFITGKSAKSAYKIDTPTGTIGVRGTKFDFTVTKTKTDIVLFDGEVNYCPKSGGCTAVKDACDVGLGQSGGAGILAKGSDGHESAAGNFRYVKSQIGLRSDFKVGAASKCGGGTTSRQSAVEPEQKSSGKQPGSPDPVPDPLPDPMPD